MTRDWFCQIAERQYGPLTIDQLKRMAASGQLPKDAPVRHGETGEWYYAATMPGIFEPPAPAPAAPNSASTKRASASASSTAKINKSPASSAKAASASHSSGSIPVGKPVAVPASAIPAGRPVAPQGGPFVADGPATLPFHSSSRSNSARAAGKNSSNKKLFYIAGGVVAVLLIGLVVVLTRDPQKTAVAKNGSPATASTDPVIEAPSENAAALPSTNNKSAVVKTPVAAAGKVAASKTVNAPVSPTEKLLKGITKWTDLSKGPGTTFKSATLQINVSIVSVWTDGTASTVAAGEAATPPNSNRYFVEVAVTNLATSAAPLTYQSWNGKAGQGSHVAILADPQFKPAVLLPAPKTPNVARQSSPVRLKPGDSVTDVLVFETSTAANELWHLVLPFAALAPGDKPFAFKIPKSSILSERPTDAKQVAKKEAAPVPIDAAVVPAPATVAASEPNPEEPPAVAKPAAPPLTKIPPRADQEEIDEFNKIKKQLEEQAAKDREEKKKPGTAPPAENNDAPK